MVARLHGVVPMLVTPFEADGAVDERSLRRLSTQQLEAGAHGLAVLGLAGEGTFLSIEERERVAAVVGEVAGGVPLLVGCTADTTAETVRLAAGAASLGASMIMVAPPRRPDWGPDELLVHYRTVAEAAGCTVMVQDAPGFIGVGLGVDFVLALAREVANVRAYKVEALPFWEHARRARLAAGDALSIFGGHGGLYLLDVLEVGADGVIPGSEATAALVRAWRAYAHSDRTDALREYARVLPFLVHAAQSLGLLIGGAKLLLHASGMIATTQARHPEAHLSDTERDRFLDLARRVGLL